MSYRLRIWLYCMLLRMSSVKIKKIKVFFAVPIMSDSEKSRFPKYAMLGSGRLLPRAHFMRYIFSSIQFNSFHFISILFYSAWRKLRMITNDNEWKRNKTKITKCYEMLRKKRKLRNVTKKRKMLLNNHVIVIFYVKTVYFFIHLKNETIAFFLFFVLFRFFRFYSLFVNYDFFTK